MVESCSVCNNGSIADIYASQASLYGMQGQGSYGPSHLAPQLHGLQARSIDGYVLQNHSPHNTSLTPPHTHAGSYSGVSAYVNMSFGNIGLAGSLSALTISPLMPYFYVYSNSLELGARRYLHVTCCLPCLVFLECPFDLWAMADFLIISHLYFGLAYTITTMAITWSLRSRVHPSDNIECPHVTVDDGNCRKKNARD
jgi:hypothetical protein